MKKMRTKTLAMLTCVMVLLVGAAGATLAWLTDTTQTITNTFTVGNIDITLTETGATPETGDQTKEYKMIPGKQESKDPTVTVEAGSEACWVFVKVEKTANFDTFMDYSINTAWTALEDVDGVYYIDQADLSAEGAVDAVYSVLANDQVTVKSTVTKEMMDALEEEGATLPNISFKAYAVQKYGFDTAAAAWAEASK